MTETGNPWVDPIDEWIETKKGNLDREMNDGQYSDQLALLVHLQKFMKTLPKAYFVDGKIDYEVHEGQMVIILPPSTDFAKQDVGMCVRVGIEVKND